MNGLSQPITLTGIVWEIVRRQSEIAAAPALFVHPDQLAAQVNFGTPQAMRAELDRVGMLAPSGVDVVPALLEAMTTVAHPRVGAYGWHHSDGTQTGVVAAMGADGSTVTAMTDGRQVTLIPQRSRDVVALVVGMIPDFAAGQGETLSLLEDDYRDMVAGRTGARRSESGVTVLHTVGASTRTERRSNDYSRLLHLPRHGHGQLFATAVSRMGRRDETPPVSYVDTHAGRWVFSTERSAQGTWYHAVPAGRDELARQLGRALTRITG